VSKPTSALKLKNKLIVLSHHQYIVVLINGLPIELNNSKTGNEKHITPNNQKRQKAYI
jgi:hypothetical protein